MSKSPTTTEDVWSNDAAEWLDNPHAGDILESEFLSPIKLTAADLAGRVGVPASQLDLIIAGKRSIDAEVDLRLARYFGMSEGFFLRLQNSYDLLQAKRRLNGALDRIVPRAA